MINLFGSIIHYYEFCEEIVLCWLYMKIRALNIQ